MYLPQFHRTPENDKWWGEGFTDWTAVKEARPLFEGHNQPRAPYENNYYDLMEHDTMAWQAELMKKYGIDGQCIYHYYFKDGCMTLEKPAQNLLRWKDIDMPFCFCWANYGWVRTWNNDAWADKFTKGKEAEVLIEQKYGSKEQWEDHFQYLLSFFKDKRYITLEGKPVFVIYAPDIIYCIEDMLSYWKQRAVECGLPGLYVITCGREAYRNADAIWVHSPQMFWNRKKLKNDIDGFRVDYDETWDNILKEPVHPAATTYFEGFADYDDTPRRGSQGTLVEGFDLEKYYENMVKLYKKSIEIGNEVVFFNAWNEWGEGMYLEPDEKLGLKPLELLKKAKEYALNNFNIEMTSENDFKAKYLQKERLAYKNQRLYKCLDKWMELKEKGSSIADYLNRKNIKTVAIYGFAMMGKHVLRELEDSSIEVKYMIDRNTSRHNTPIEIKKPDDKLSYVDAVIVTPILEFSSISKSMKERLDTRYISIEELIYEL